MSDNYINSNGVSRLWKNILQKLNSYVTKNGDGATGTWNINISGNATSATKATQDGAGNVIVNTYATKNEIKQPDWKQTDETAMDFIKNKPTENDALELLAEMGFISPAAADDGSVFTDENGALYTL